MYIVLFMKFTFASMTNVMLCLFVKFINYFVILNHVTFFPLVDFTHAVFCLHYLLPYVGNIVTIGTNGIIGGTIGKTLNDICLPLIKMLPMVRTPRYPYCGSFHG